MEKFSAIYVSRNELTLLKKSIESIQELCDEIIIFDLKSGDGTFEYFKTYHKESKIKCYTHEVVPASEWIQAEFLDKTKNKWVFLVDPDEIYTKQLIEKIIFYFEIYSNDLNIGAFSFPMKFYFKGKEISSTKWGGVKWRTALVNNSRFECFPRVQTGRQLKKGYSSFEIPFEVDNFIMHFWVKGWHDLIKKHLRYLKYEGISRFNIGGKTTLLRIFYIPIVEFYENYFIRYGYKQGFFGFSLSMFRSFYIFGIHYQLYRVMILTKLFGNNCGDNKQ